MFADPELVKRYKDEMAACLAAEVALWEAKSWEQAKRDLEAHGGRYWAERTHCDVAYNLDVELLAEDDATMTLLIEIQPANPAHIDIIAVPRPPGSGGWAGWTDEEMGMMSEMIFLRE